MKCEEFETFGLDADHDRALSDLERVAARQHAENCSRCASLQDSWSAAQSELRALALDTRSASAPARMEMRLRQEFKMQHRSVATERVAAVAMWVLATAAVLVGAISWHSWKSNRQIDAQDQVVRPVNSDTGVATGSQSTSAFADAGDLDGDETLVADSDGSGFTLLPGTFPSDAEDSAIMRVRLQRSALGAMGLPVNPETASDWVQVDLLVGIDGQPQGVRLPE